MISLLGALALELTAAQAGALLEGSYRVGAGDVLEVTVEGRPDLSRVPTVQPTGAVWLPAAGAVEAQGLTEDEIAARIAGRLAASGQEALRVRVRVRDYQSQSVFVRGAVVRPGRRMLRGATRLIDVLLEAGGFLPGASGDVVIERTNGVFEDGSRSLKLRLPRESPSAEGLERLALRLVAGDVVIAAAQEWVFVAGAVKRPGRYAYSAGLTLGRLVAAAGGLLRTADRRVRLLRRAKGEARVGEIEVDLDAIRRGQAEDPVLRAGDEVSVRARRL